MSIAEKLANADKTLIKTKEKISAMIAEYESKPEGNELKEKVIGLLRSTNIHGLNRLIDSLSEKDEYGMNFWNQPGSIKHHNNKLGGLLVHSYQTYEKLKLICQNTPNCTISEQSQIIIGIFHDLCKWKSYGFKITPKTKELSVDIFEWNNSLALGHGEKSVMILQKYIPLTPLEQMCIRWHMGSFDKAYFENQTDIDKLCPEARLVFLADMWASGVEE